MSDNFRQFWSWDSSTSLWVKKMSVKNGRLLPPRKAQKSEEMLICLELVLLGCLFDVILCCGCSVCVKQWVIFCFKMLKENIPFGVLQFVLHFIVLWRTISKKKNIVSMVCHSNVYIWQFNLLDPIVCSWIRSKNKSFYRRWFM